MERHIGIVGAGIAGLHLGLDLRDHDIDVTIISDRTRNQFSNSRLPNTAGHFADTIAREKSLGVDHWPDAQFHYVCHNHSFGGPNRIEFRGDFSRPSRAVDHRVYLPKLMEDFETRGGRIEIASVGASDLARLAARFDLLVVAAGRGPLANAFDPVTAWLPCGQPQRHLLACVFNGIRRTDPVGATLSVSPGQGELIEIPFLTFGGMASALLFEQIPGSGLSSLMHLRYADDPRGFVATILEMIEQHHPHIYNRIDTAAFDLCGPNDATQGAITPIVRRSTLDLGEGKFAFAVGDVHCTVDPLLAQGANYAAHAASVLAEEIIQDVALDAKFCERAEWRLQPRAVAASRWTNLMLQPPSPQMMEFVLEMSCNQALCDEFTDNFSNPERQWDHLASPRRIRAWIDSHRRVRSAAAVA